MSLSFLGQKSFHPSNPQNLRKLFQAEEKKANEAKKAEELKRQWEQEETRRQSKSLLEKGAPAEAPMSTAFMYQLPPGLKEAQERQKREAAAAMAARDAAAAAPAAATTGGHGGLPGDDAPKQTRAERDAERFAILKNAPRSGEYTNDLAVNHRPFGVALRQVKCTRCGEWGHQAGDRECRLRHELTEQDEARKAVDDPLQRATAGAEAGGGALRWEPKKAPEEGMHGGASRDDANQQFVSMLDEDDAAALAAAAGLGGGGAATMADLDPAVLALLDEKQQRKLLKMYQKEQRREELGDGDDDGERERKRKKHHHHHKSDKEKKKHRHKEKRHKEKRSSKGERRDRDDSGSDSGS